MTANLLRTGDLGKLRQRGPGEAWLLIRALAWLGLTRAGILALPFRVLVRVVGLVQGAGREELTPDEFAEGRRIGWAIRSASIRAPWECACLARALACAVMLRRRKVPFTLYLGVARPGSEPGGFSAHAWLQSGTEFLTGGEVRHSYSIISRHTSGTP